MSVKEKATDLWNRLVIAMRQDGLIATSIKESGPATTALIVELVGAPWLPMSNLPQPMRQVLAQDDDGNYHIAWYDDHWFTNDDNFVGRLQQWKYLP